MKNEDTELVDKIDNFELIDRAVGQQLEGVEHEYLAINEIWARATGPRRSPSTCYFRVIRNHPKCSAYFGVPTTRVEFWNGERWTDLYGFTSTADTNNDRLRALEVADEVVR